MQQAVRCFVANASQHLSELINIYNIRIIRKRFGPVKIYAQNCLQAPAE